MEEQRKINETVKYARNKYSSSRNVKKHLISHFYYGFCIVSSRAPRFWYLEMKFWAEISTAVSCVYSLSTTNV